MSNDNLDNKDTTNEVDKDSKDDKDSEEDNNSVAAKKTNSPGTGDDTNMYIWIALAVLSLGGMAGSLAYRKYKR